MTMVLSTLQEASQTSWGDHDTSITSVNTEKPRSQNCFSVTLMFCDSYRRCGSSGSSHTSTVPRWPAYCWIRTRYSGRLICTGREKRFCRRGLVYCERCVNGGSFSGCCVCTYAALFHTMTSLSSPPDARYSPLLDQRTQFTHAAHTTHTHTHKSESQLFSQQKTESFVM